VSEPDDACFYGHPKRECGEHRTVGSHRAWCHDCGEWCYPDIPCRGCGPDYEALLDLALATIAYICEKGEAHWNAPVVNDVPPVLHELLPKATVYDRARTAAECLAPFNRLGPERDGFRGED